MAESAGYDRTNSLAHPVIKSHTGMEDEQCHGQASRYHYDSGQWMESGCSLCLFFEPPPIDECGSFASSQLPTELPYTGAQPLRTYRQLLPSITPRWPSMLTSQSTYVPPACSAAALPVPSVSTTVSTSTGATEPVDKRKKPLTDSERRRMCLYHEEHPEFKQTEIGGKPTADTLAYEPR